MLGLPLSQGSEGFARGECRSLGRCRAAPQRPSAVPATRRAPGACLVRVNRRCAADHPRAGRQWDAFARFGGPSVGLERPHLGRHGVVPHPWAV